VERNDHLENALTEPSGRAIRIAADREYDPAPQPAVARQIRGLGPGVAVTTHALDLERVSHDANQDVLARHAGQLGPHDESIGALEGIERRPDPGTEAGLREGPRVDDAVDRRDGLRLAAMRGPNAPSAARCAGGMRPTRIGALW